MKRNTSNIWIFLVLIILLFAIGSALVVSLRNSRGTMSGAKQGNQNVQLLSEEQVPLVDSVQQREFRFEDVPPWLFVHVAVIASLQVFALIAAQFLRARPLPTKAGQSMIQFLCEIPMYLGLFGTLLGVCLTQFITGSLVAPLAYLTTMSGIVLHVFGKLVIWLPVSNCVEFED
jgi:hypothetical protein